MTKPRFFQLLRRYIHDLYHGRLVHSTEFLTLFFESFPDIFKPNECQVRVAEICKKWLDTPLIPDELHQKFKTVSFPSTLNTATDYWIKLSKRKRVRDRIGASLTTEELVILLERLLELPKIRKCVLQALDQRYRFKVQNADVQHRWCELIVKHECGNKVDFVTEFLTEHQSMGIYLYGEMLNGNFRQTALDTFTKLQTEMDPTMSRNIQDLIDSS